LLCEALFFNKAETCIKKANEIALGSGDQIRIWKHTLKFSSFWKKFGFFEKALEILQTMQSELEGNEAKVN